MADIRCPECMRMDPVQALVGVKKVSVVVDEGKSQGSFYGSTGGYVYSKQGGYMVGSTSGAVQMITDLSRDLACPDAPTYQSPWGVWSILGVICSILMLIGIACTVAGSFFLTMDAAHVAGGVPPSSSVDPVALVLSLGRFLIYPLVAIVTLVLIVRSKAKTAAFRKAAVARNSPLWQYARDIWDELYYCPRHDGVYFPPAGRRLFYPDGTAVPAGVLVPKWQLRAFCRFP